MIQERHKQGGTHRIPSNVGQKSKGAAARVTTRLNVLEAPEFGGVQQWIEETKRGLGSENTEVINQRDYAHHCLDVGSQLGACERTR